MHARTPELAIPVSADDHAQGSRSATVTLVEYGDYQCPACGMAYPGIKRLQRGFGKSLRFVFRNFPLTEAHPLARPAAELAEAASLLHQFWPMHDWLYENQDAWTAYGTEGLEAGLRQVGLDESEVAQILRRPGIDARIRADFMGGVRSGVNGTPCFFLDGYRVDGGVADLEYAIAERTNES
ncbi:MAG: DsbA family protein [Xanthomonadales bacterium]|nr:DsbA family protein [Xanthomonadales bacterium]ODU94288.1 MAG: disulfide bond formation protein DsbA [Rhodanobacter sp. SCN 66-43]OJY86896.1 MAG: disulfide bond formation protein DsbA [Xanthomonadales bacterium 66-474]